MNNIEDTVFTNALPVNTLAVLERLKVLIQEHKTNNIEQAIGTGAETDNRILACLWLLNAQYVGSVADISMAEWWTEIGKKLWNS